MSDAALHGLALVAATGGMVALAFTNNVHWRQLFGARAQTAAMRAICRAVGAALLGLSFAICAMADPVSMAILVWPMLLGVAAAAVAAAFTLQTRHSAARIRRAGPNG